MRCWGWHERPLTWVLRAAFAAVVISADAGCLPWARPLSPDTCHRSPSSFIGMSGSMLVPGLTRTPALRGVRHCAPRLHHGRLLTIAADVELFNLVLGLRLTQTEDPITL